MKDMTNATLDYYNRNAEAFAEGTVNVDFAETQDKFLGLIPAGGHILDFGCGAGRDAKYFTGKGYKVDAVDGSEELCRIAASLTGIPVRQMLFRDLNEREKYDGIWACSSILHLSQKELKDVIPKMLAALKAGGYIYTSFKYGAFEGERNGRYFTDFTEETFEAFFRECNTENAAREMPAEECGARITKMWVTGDVRPGREDEKWLNIFIEKGIAND